MKSPASRSRHSGLMMVGGFSAMLVASAPAVTDESTGHPEAVVFVADDRSIYTGTHPEAWGVQFRVDDWSRAYTQFDLPSPVKTGRTLAVLSPAGLDGALRVLVDAGKGVLGSP